MKTAIIAVLFLLALPVTASAQTAPGGPGADALWTEADKDGYGTSTGTASQVWHTLDDGRLTEVFYPDLGTPSVRTLDFIVSDGTTFAQRTATPRIAASSSLDSRSLTYQQVNEQPGRFRRDQDLRDRPGPDVSSSTCRFESLTGQEALPLRAARPEPRQRRHGRQRHSSGDALLAQRRRQPRVERARRARPPSRDVERLPRHAQRRPGGPARLPHGRAPTRPRRTGTSSRPRRRRSPA